MKDNSLKYCTTIVFAAALISMGLALSSGKQSYSFDEIYGWVGFITGGIWLAVCFGDKFRKQ